MKNLTTLFQKFTLITLALFVIGCQQEDDLKNDQLSLEQPNKSVSKIVSAKDIPGVMQFLESKINKNLQIIIDDTNNPDFAYRNHEENLTIVTLLKKKLDR